MGLFVLAGAVHPPAAVPTLPAPVVLVPPPAYTLTLTGYNAVPEQTDGDPFVTASGAYTNPEVVAARSRDLADELPFGTVIAIEGPPERAGSCGYGAVGETIGYRVVADTMHQRFTKRVDVVFGADDRYVLPNGRTMNAATLLGICPGVIVTVVGFVDISDPSNLPQTQRELRDIVERSSRLALRD
jgi:3D (Asp-Asp-Asp) domain-containing protein